MILIVIWLAFAVGSAAIASGKGRSPAGWFVIGLLGGFIALLVIAVLPSERAPVGIPGYIAPNTPVKACPFCREHIRVDATVCRFCHRDLPDQVDYPPHHCQRCGNPPALPPTARCIRCGAVMPSGTWSGPPGSLPPA